MSVSFATIFLLLIIITPSVSFADTTLTYEYDANGNMIRGDGKYYEYNDANQMVKVRHGDQNGPVIAEYVYDYTGQRVKKIENGVTTYYIGKHYETQSNGIATTNTSYYFANAERVAKKDSSGSMFYYHSDHLGGTNVVTDASGNIVERTKYYPFGEIREGGNEKYLYTGKERDKSTDWYYYEARYYNPDFKHFTQADTIVPEPYDPQSLNRYAYVRNNPMKYVDPSGHRKIGEEGKRDLKIGEDDPKIYLLQSPKGAKGFGHIAMIVEERRNGKIVYRYFSKENVKDGELFGDVRIDKKDYDSGGSMEDIIAKINENFKESYENYYVIHTDELAAQKTIAYADSSDRSSREKYNVLSSNCEDYVLDSIKAGQVKTQYVHEVAQPNGLFDRAERENMRDANPGLIIR